MTAVLNISQQNFGSSEKLSIFVVQNVANQATKDISNRFNTAGFLVTDYLRMIGTFCKTLQRNSVLLLYTYHKFCFTKMQNVNKNLNRTAQGASASTANTRNSVKSVRPSSSVTITPNKLYQITMDLVVSYNEPTGRVRRCGVIHTDIYQASSENEAFGLALSVVRAKYGCYHDIDLKSIKRTQTYNI